MKTYTCPHPDHDGPPATLVYQNESHDWLCFEKHRFSLRIADEGEFFQNATGGFRYPALPYADTNLIHFEEKEFDPSDLADPLARAAPKTEPVELPAPKPTPPIELNNLLSMDKHPSRRIEGYRAHVTENGDFKKLHVRDGDRLIVQIHTDHHEEVILISGLLSKEETITLLNDLSYSGLIHFEKITEVATEREYRESHTMEDYPVALRIRAE